MYMNFVEAFKNYLSVGEAIEDVETGKQYKMFDDVLHEKKRDWPDEPEHDWQESLETLTDLYSKQFAKVGLHLLTKIDRDFINWSKKLGVIRTIEKSAIDETTDKIIINIGMNNHQKIEFTVIRNYLFGLLKYDTKYYYSYLEDRIDESVEKY